MIIAQLDCLGKTLFDNRFERLADSAEEGEICELMHTEKEGYAYNELVTHLPLHAVHAPKNALILGGGSLFTAREAIKHPSLESVDVVDYDSEITNLVIRHYDSSLSQVREDPRVRIHSADVREFLRHVDKEQYDVVIDDLIDVVRLEDRWVLDLFPLVRRTLKRHGLFSSYLYPSWYHGELNRLILERLRNAGFGRIFVTDENVFTYSWPEGFTAFLCAAPEWPWSTEETNGMMLESFTTRCTTTLQYHPEIHPLRESSEHPSVFGGPRLSGGFALS